jgi:putative ABC transport system substrate-binding protein
MAASTPAALAAKQATKTIPIVFTAVADPVTSSVVTSLAQPGGGNVTGLSVLAPELVGKCLELITQAVPCLQRVLFRAFTVPPPPAAAGSRQTGLPVSHDPL